MSQPQSLVPARDLFGYVQSVSSTQKLARSRSPATPATSPPWAELSDRELARCAVGLACELVGRVSASRGHGTQPDLERAIEELTRGLEQLKPHRSKQRARRKQTAASPIHSGKRNAIRAALSAGVKPTQVAKHFGPSLADVNKLASEPGEKV